MNAYELADLNDWACCANSKEVSAMLRQQADLIRNLQETLGFLRSGYESINLTPQTKPLSDEEIYALWCEADNTELLPEMRLKDGSINYIITTFAKLIEERHGIK